jgi:hypothetical protein
MGGSSKSGGNEAKLARKDEKQRQARIREGTTRVNGIFDGQFNDGFFNNQRKAYLDYAAPQVNDQYGNAQKELTFALTRAGLLDSSVRGQKVGELQKQYDLQNQKVADDALSYATKARTGVEDARSNLITTLNATGDAEGAASSALARSASLSQPAAYSPLTQLFSAFTSGLGQQAAQDRANYYSNGGSTAGGSSAGLFSRGSGSVRVS